MCFGSSRSVNSTGQINTNPPDNIPLYGVYDNDGEIRPTRWSKYPKGVRVDIRWPWMPKFMIHIIFIVIKPMFKVKVSAFIMFRCVPFSPNLFMWEAHFYRCTLQSGPAAKWHVRCGNLESVERLTHFGFFIFKNIEYFKLHPLCFVEHERLRQHFTHHHDSRAFHVRLCFIMHEHRFMDQMEPSFHHSVKTIYFFIISIRGVQPPPQVSRN